MSEASKYKAALEKAYVLFPRIGVHAGCCRDTLMIEEGQQQVIAHFKEALDKDTLGNFNIAPIQEELDLRRYSRS